MFIDLFIYLIHFLLRTRVGAQETCQFVLGLFLYTGICNLKYVGNNILRDKKIENMF